MQGKRINKQRMMRYQELDKVQDNATTLHQGKVQLKSAKEKWEKFISNERRFKEEKLLD